MLEREESHMMGLLNAQMLNELCSSSTQQSEKPKNTSHNLIKEKKSKPKFASY